MNKKILFIVLLFSAIALGAIDFAINGYAERLGLKADVQSLVEMNTSYVEQIEASDDTIKLFNLKGVARKVKI